MTNLTHNPFSYIFYSSSLRVSSNDHLHRVTYTRSRIDTVDPSDNEHLAVRNMQRIGINKYTRKNCASIWSFIKIPRNRVFFSASEVQDQFDLGDSISDFFF